MSVAKGVINRQTGNHLSCCWTGPDGDSCEREGREMFKIIVTEGETRIHYVFCTERHMRYHQHSHLAFGKLPPGYRTVI